jgi:uncharacterized membrane protein
MKFGVGLMLTTFGTFWAGEGIGVRWPGSDFAIVVLLAIYLVLSWLAVVAIRPKPEPAPRTAEPVGGRPQAGVEGL